MLPDHPRQALTRLEGAPDSHQYTGVAWGSHRPSDDVSLHIASHCSRGSRGKEIAREEILAVRLMHQLAPHFEVVLWRSLRDAPSCEALLDDCLQVFAPNHRGKCRPAWNDAWACS